MVSIAIALPTHCDRIAPLQKLQGLESRDGIRPKNIRETLRDVFFGHEFWDSGNPCGDRHYGLHGLMRDICRRPQARRVIIEMMFMKC